MARIARAKVVEAVQSQQGKTRPEAQVPGAVLVPLLADEEATLLFTLRSESHRKFPGEVSFPGGHREQRDRSLEATALRELEEEVNVAAHQVKVVGTLDDRGVYGRVWIRPYVGVLAKEAVASPDPREVDGVFFEALADLARPEAYEGRRIDVPGAERVVHYFRTPHGTIWGATGRIVAELLALAAGWVPPREPRRVARVEELVEDL